MLTYASRFLSGDFEPFWPHVVLLTLSVLASIAVGAGIIFERPKYSAPVHRVAFWLVVAGVAVEAVCTIFLFVFDEGISGKQRADLGAQQSIIRTQNDKIIALDEALMPRLLEQNLTAERLSKFKGLPFVIISTPESEPKNTAGEIRFMLRQAGWVPYTKALKSPFDKMIRPGVAVLIIGIDMKDVVFDKAAKELVAILNENNIEAKGPSSLPYFDDKGFPEIPQSSPQTGLISQPLVIEIEVGPKPPPPSLQLKRSFPADKNGIKVYGNVDLE
jgi:hypothetical protein